jgi:hypothetical protein
MTRSACSDVDYILFLLGAPRTATCTEAARCLGDGAAPPSHDAYTRLLARQALDPESLWVEAQTLMNPKHGALVLDDSTLDKPYAREIELVTYHWSGKHHDVVRSINLLTLLWTDGDAKIPCDFRWYDKPIGGQTKNEHFRRMLDVAKERGLSPEIVAFDTWYASLKKPEARSRSWMELVHTTRGESACDTGPWSKGCDPEDRHSGGWSAGASARLRVCPGVSDGRGGRRGSVLGHERALHDGVAACGVGASWLGHRSLSSRHQTILQCGTLPGTPRGRADWPHPSESPRVLTTRSAPSSNRGQLDDRKTPSDSGCHPRLRQKPIRSCYVGNCVSPRFIC